MLLTVFLKLILKKFLFIADYFFIFTFLLNMEMLKTFLIFFSEKFRVAKSWIALIYIWLLRRHIKNMSSIQIKICLKYSFFWWKFSKKKDSSSPFDCLWLCTVELNVKLNPSWGQVKESSRQHQNTGERNCL
jgi:hypothetical protein